MSREFQMISVVVNLSSNDRKLLKEPRWNDIEKLAFASVNESVGWEFHWVDFESILDGSESWEETFLFSRRSSI